MSAESAYIGPQEIVASGAGNSGPQVILEGGVTGQSVTYASPANTITIGGGAAPFLGLSAGDIITIAGSASNNGTKTIVSVDNTAGTVATVSETLVAESDTSPNSSIFTLLP